MFTVAHVSYITNNCCTDVRHYIFSHTFNSISYRLTRNLNLRNGKKLLVLI
jgi:hypothetical protein